MRTPRRGAIGGSLVVKGLVDAALQAYRRIDVIINNAGLMPRVPLERLKIDEWGRMIDVNIKGVLYGIATALPHASRHWFANGRGYVTNTTNRIR